MTVPVGFWGRRNKTSRRPENRVDIDNRIPYQLKVAFLGRHGNGNGKSMGGI